ncbi:MAG: TetR/AcrR family transcriptional regulator [bacterium]
MTAKEITKRILDQSKEEFSNFGFSKVTMDEIAAALGMSKKTLYKYFPSKQVLLQRVMEASMNEIRVGAEQILLDPELDFMAKLQQLLAFLGEHISQTFKQPFLKDIRKSAPDAWDKIERFREEQIHTKFSALIEEGIQKGMFRGDLIRQVVVLVYFNAIQNIINPETLSQLPFTASEVFEAIIRIIFEGILTDTARSKLQETYPNKEHKSR